MPRPPACAALLLLALALAPLARADSRADFLKLLDRPRVPLAPETLPPAARADTVEIPFSYSADATNRVPGVLVKPAGAPSARSLPAVIVLHGTGGNKESQLPLLRQFAAAGFIGVAIDGRHHGARATPGGTGKNAAYQAAILHAYRTGEGRPFFFDTAWDVMRLVDYLVTRPDIDPRRIGLMGFSKGGIETYLAAAADPRIAAAVSCIGVQSFRWALDNDSWQSRIGTVQAAFDSAARDAGIASPDAAFVRRFYDRVAPGIYGSFDGPAMLPLIAPRPLLAINGEVDPRTPLPGLQLCADAARAAYAAAGAPEKFVLRVQSATGHKVNSDSRVAAREWFARWLQP